MAPDRAKTAGPLRAKLDTAEHGRIMTSHGRTVVAAVLCASAAMGCRTERSCDLGSHKWKQNSPTGCTESGWTFTPAGNGKWAVTETGCASATGTATYDGVTVTADIQFFGNTTARYEWPVNSQCRGTTGKVTSTNGPTAGQSQPSTLSIVP